MTTARISFICAAPLFDQRTPGRNVPAGGAPVVFFLSSRLRKRPPDGGPRRGMPHFITETCIGCGVCEIKCPTHTIDRKSTRLNSSHLGISYAVFCLKK